MIAPQDREKTSFITKMEAFQYLFMPFRLCNAPTTFQRAMIAIFKDYLQKFMAIFVNEYHKWDFEKFADKKAVLGSRKT